MAPQASRAVRAPVTFKKQKDHERAIEILEVAPPPGPPALRIVLGEHRPKGGRQVVVNVGRGTKWSRALAHVFARREEPGSTDQMGLEEAGRGAYRRWLRLGDVRAVDMNEEGGGLCQRGSAPRRISNSWWGTKW